MIVVRFEYIRGDHGQFTIIGIVFEREAGFVYISRIRVQVGQSRHFMLNSPS